MDLIIFPITSDTSFWKAIEENKDKKITDLFFKVYAENMPVGNVDATKFIKNIRSNMKADSTLLHAESKSGLQISHEDKNIDNMNQASSSGIAELKVYTKNEKNRRESIYDSSNKNNITKIDLEDNIFDTMANNKKFANNIDEECIKKLSQFKQRNDEKSC